MKIYREGRVDGPCGAGCCHYYRTIEVHDTISGDVREVLRAKVDRSGRAHWGSKVTYAKLMRYLPLLGKLNARNAMREILDTTPVHVTTHDDMHSLCRSKTCCRISSM